MKNADQIRQEQKIMEDSLAEDRKRKEESLLHDLKRKNRIEAEYILNEIMKSCDSIVDSAGTKEGIRGVALLKVVFENQIDQDFFNTLKDKIESHGYKFSIVSSGRVPTYIYQYKIPLIKLCANSGVEYTVLVEW